MYTLILIVVGFNSAPSVAPTVAVTQYTVGTKDKCEQHRELLMAQNRKDGSVLVRATCLPP